MISKYQMRQWKKLLSPLLVFFVGSISGFLPVITLFLLGGENAMDYLFSPELYRESVENFHGIEAVLFISSVGDAIGYYLIAILVGVAFLSIRNKTGVVSSLLIIAYGVNGALWAICLAVRLPAAIRDPEMWGQVTQVCQNIGWGIIGNTLGSIGWIVLGIAVLKNRKTAFGVFTISLGMAYLIAGELWRPNVPEFASTLGIIYYLFLQLLIWNPWAAKIAQDELDCSFGSVR